MTEREIDLAMDKLIGRVWDEERCRVCGWPLGELTNGACIQGNCSLRPHPKEGSPRANDPLPHATSWEQIAKDREMLPAELHDAFTDELWKLFWTPDAAHVNMIWLMVNATPRQQSIAMLRAHGERIEE